MIHIRQYFREGGWATYCGLSMYKLAEDEDSWSESRSTFHILIKHHETWQSRVCHACTVAERLAGDD